MNGLPSHHHLADIPGIVSPVSGDDESGKSWGDDDTLDSLPNSPGSEMARLTEQAVQLLDSYVYSDPVVELTEFYANKGIPNVDEYFQERQRDEDTRRLFRYTFECPLRGTFYHTSLPLPLFSSELPLDLLVHLSEQVLGKDYEILEDGVFFSARKHAKRSAALAALESLAPMTQEGIMYPSPREASIKLSEFSMSIPIRTTHYPSWVHELCRLGVSAKRLKITYAESYSEQTEGWTCQSTMVSCIVSISKPLQSTAVGLPCGTKAEALESAIALLLEEVNRQLPDFGEDLTYTPSNQELGDLLACDPNDGIFVYPVPRWASEPLGWTSNTKQQQDSFAAPCLYELEFISSESDEIVVLGVVFAGDPEPAGSNGKDPFVFETEFVVPDEDETIAVRMQKCHALEGSHWSSTGHDERLQWMQQFQKIAIRRWNQGEDIESQGSPSDVVLPNRTYAFVPVTPFAFPTVLSSTIDWQMLQRLCQERESGPVTSTFLQRLQDLIVFSSLGVCICAPSMPIALFQNIFQMDPAVGGGTRAWESALVGLFLLILVCYVVFTASRSKRVEPSLRELQMISHANLFMPLLEREIEAAGFARQLCSIASRINAEAYSGKEEKSTYECSPTLPSSVKEATSIVPNLTYQRLELLGDSVLVFYLSVNLVAMNASLQWDSDELGRIIMEGSSNRVLRDAALSCGIARLLLGHRQESPISYSVYKKSCMSKESPFNSSRLVQSLLSIQSLPTGRVHDHVLSDVAESLLGVAYLEGKNCSDDPYAGRMAIALLEEFKLPFPEQDDVLPFFRAAGPCLKSGYPFNQHTAWRRQLVQIGTTLYCEHEVIDRLETGWLKLLGKLYDSNVSSHGGGYRAVMEKQRSKILLLCALFNDNLTDHSDSISFRRMGSSLSSTSVSTVESNASVESTNTQGGLIRIALLRDTLFIIGHASLNLAITNELYHLYPEASEGSLSLQRACATSDDATAYVMVKNGVHECLYNQKTRAENRFHSEMSAADSIGVKIWQRRNGWILKGGELEYAERCNSLSFSMPQQGPSPRYCGLGGGRLYGHKTKLSETVTEDFVVAFKAIAGGLVLSLGLEGMWETLGPLFGELLLLSADELRREYCRVSSICK